MLRLWKKVDSAWRREQSGGHIIFREYHTTGDGLLTAPAAAEALVEEGGKSVRTGSSVALSSSGAAQLPRKTKKGGGRKIPAFARLCTGWNAA